MAVWLRDLPSQGTGVPDWVWVWILPLPLSGDYHSCQGSLSQRAGTLTIGTNIQDTIMVSWYSNSSELDFVLKIRYKILLFTTVLCLQKKITKIVQRIPLYITLNFYSEQYLSLVQGIDSLLLMKANSCVGCHLHLTDLSEFILQLAVGSP